LIGIVGKKQEGGVESGNIFLEEFKDAGGGFDLGDLN